MSSPPASARSRRPTFTAHGLEQRPIWLQIATIVYEQTGLSYDDGPLALMDALGIEWDEDRGDRAPDEDLVLFDPDLPRYERNLGFYWRIAEILLRRAGRETPVRAIATVARVLILPDLELTHDEVEGANPHVAPEILHDIVARREGFQELPAAG